MPGPWTCEMTSPLENALELNLESPAECPLCGSESHTIFEKYGHWIFQCKSCDHYFSLPANPGSHASQVYSDEYFLGRADGYPDYVTESALLVSRGMKYARLMSRFVEPTRCLDVGAAAGFLLKGFVENGWEGVGLEPNAAMLAYGKEHLQLDMRQGTLEDNGIGEQFDLVLMIQVIAHLHDIQQGLKNLAALSRHGGFVLIETWDRASLTARTLKGKWHEFNPPSVLHWFTKKRLISLMEEHGFYLIATGRPLKWISISHAISLGLHRTKPLGKRRFLDRIAPNWAIPYPSEDLFWSVFRHREPSIDGLTNRDTVAGMTAKSRHLSSVT